MSVEAMRGTLRALAEDPKDFEAGEFQEWKEGYLCALRAVQKLAKGALEGEEDAKDAGEI